MANILPKGIHSRLPLTKCLIVDINFSNTAFSLPSESKFLRLQLQLMEFIFTQMSRTLITIDRESDVLEPNEIWQGRDINDTYYVAIRMSYLSQPIIDTGDSSLTFLL